MTSQLDGYDRALRNAGRFIIVIMFALAALSFVASLYHASTLPNDLGFVFAPLFFAVGCFAAWLGVQMIRGKL